MDGYMSVYTQFLTFDNAASTTMVKYRQAELGHTEANGPTDGDNYGRGENRFQLDGRTDERVRECVEGGGGGGMEGEGAGECGWREEEDKKKKWSGGTAAAEP